MLRGYGTGVVPQEGQWLAEVVNPAHISSAAVKSRRLEVNAILERERERET